MEINRPRSFISKIHKSEPDINIGFSPAFHLQCFYKEEKNNSPTTDCWERDRRPARAGPSVTLEGNVSLLLEEDEEGSLGDSKEGGVMRQLDISYA